MTEWSQTELDVVTSMLRRGTAPTYVDDSEVLAIGQRCIRNEGFDPHAARPHDASVPAPVTPEVGDVLVNSTGTGTIGRSCVYRETTRRYTVDSHVTLIRLHPDRADGRVINEIIRSPRGQRYLESHCYTGSTNQIELSPTAIGRMPLTLPAIEEQQRIAEILDTIDDTIRATERIIVKHEEVLAGLQAVLLGSGAPVTIRELIDGHWAGEWGTDGAGEGLRKVLVLRATNIDGYHLDYSTAAVRFVLAQRAELKRLRSGDLILEGAGGGPGVPVGRVSRYIDQPGDDPYLTSNFFRAIRPATGVDPGYLFWILDGEYRKPSIWSCQQQTTGIINLSVADYLDRTVTFDADRQRHIVNTLDAALDVIDHFRGEVSKLRQLRLGLAADLISPRMRTVPL